MAVTLPNGIKELFKQDKIALGMNVRLARSGEIAALAKATGHDFVFIDGQHATTMRGTYEELAAGFQALVDTGLLEGPLKGGPERSIALVREAENLGYDSTWCGESYGVDAVTRLAWLGGQTSRIKLGSSILQVPARTPALNCVQPGPIAIGLVFTALKPRRTASSPRRLR